jgi:6-pyruvoyltetrahydropterin/6-carboxytetrahydropterin synthase
MTAQLDSFSSWPSSPHAFLARRYRLSASHRLHSETFTEAENQNVYGKCNNPHGHGHNYIVEVSLSGPVDPTTGMVCDLAALDAFAQQNLLDPFDKQNLNTLAPFRDLVSTTENFTLEVFRIFQLFPGAKLDRVRIEETGNNSFEYTESSVKGPTP